MFDKHRWLRTGKRNAAAVTVLAVLFAAWASCGYTQRIRYGHSPLAFDEYGPLDTISALGGLAVAGVAFFVWWGMALRLGHVDAKQDFRFFQRAGAPRTIYRLLLAIASRDGLLERREFAAVEQVLLRDLGDDVSPHDLRNWGMQPNHMTPIDAAKHLAQILTPAERMSVLRWCREIAAADGRQSAPETELLRDVARILSG